MTELLVGVALTARDPRQLGRWTIQSRIGFGGMGVVYLATDGHQQAAVKVIRPGLLDDPNVQDRFGREVAVLQAVRDLHISQFLDANLTSEPAWLAIEYVSGPTVKEAVVADGPLPAEQWWGLARGMAQALAVLDVHRITHRDIKPGNVILSEDRAVLIDFGIAHPEDATSLTATGLVTGSPSWLSPEQATSEPTGAPSDVFSLGSMLAYAGTGRAPFGEGVAVAVLMRIASAEPDLDGLSPDQAGLVAAMLVKDPANRPSARDVLALTRVDARDRPRVIFDNDSTTSTLALKVDRTRVSSPGRKGRQPAAADSSTTAPIQALPRGAAQKLPKRRRGAVAIAVAIGLALVVWMGVSGSQDGGAPSPSPSPTAAPTPTVGPTPAAPSSDQLKSGQWLLSSYRLQNNSSGMTISGTLVNQGADAASAFVTAYVYVNGESIGSVSTTVTDVPAKGSVEVTMSGDAVWKPGNKVLLVQADPV